MVGPTDRAEVSGHVGNVGVLTEKLKVIYEDSDVVIVDKPAGLLTSTHPDETRPTALAILEHHFAEKNYKAQVKLVHRLDRDASGLLVFARNRTAFEKLKVQFEAHTITRVYTLVVHGTPKKSKARLTHILYEDPEAIVHVTPDRNRGKEAILDYEVVEPGSSLSLVRCTLHTGRKHQIRVQLATIGHPVFGDTVYGKPEAHPTRLALHASTLAFDHPGTGKRVEFASAPPVMFRQMLHSVLRPSQAPAPVVKAPLKSPFKGPFKDPLKGPKKTAFGARAKAPNPRIGHHK